MIEPRKDKYETDYRELAKSFSIKSELRDPGFWKEYLYWSWRCLLFVLFIAIPTNYDHREGIVGSFDHIGPTTWAVIIVVTLAFGPAFVAGWSYLWMRGQDLFERLRR